MQQGRNEALLDSNLKQALRPYRQKMMLHAALTAAGTAGVILLPFLLLTSFGLVLAGRMKICLFVVLFCIWLLFSLFLYGLRYRPNNQALARWLDGYCGDDRVATAL